LVIKAIVTTIQQISKASHENRFLAACRSESEMDATMMPAMAGPHVARNINGRKRYFSRITAMYENPSPHVIRKVMMKKDVT
jgi:hypothetical protein